jgi:hypothetical protein
MPADDSSDDDTVRMPLTEAVPLADFLAHRTLMTVAERQVVIEQAIGILRHVYVHLPVKQALYGIDPVARLLALRDRLHTARPDEDLAFHREMVAILSSCRDMHTGYYLPRPFDRSVAFLPLQIEDFYDGPTPRYVVTRTLPGGPGATEDATRLQRGVEVLQWDGDPIDAAVEREGAVSPGINAEARRARGVYRLTTRFLAKCPPPERAQVRVTYRDTDGTVRNHTVTWRVATLPAGVASLAEGTPIGQSGPAQDFETEVFLALKRELAARQQALPQAPAAAAPAPLPTSLPGVFEAFARTAPDGQTYGYLRIRSFALDDAAQAAGEFNRLVAALPPRGLVIDVRDNPGGSIQAAEMMVQALAGRPLDRAPLLFRTTPFILRLCERWPEVYQRWTPTLARAQRTGATYSAGVPLWPDSSYAAVSPCHAGPVVLIVNALSYSATDFFAAAFQDHAVGRVLGTHGSTGGGGANLRTLQSLVDEIGTDRQRFEDIWPPVALPQGADIHVAFRRSLRTGRYAGLEVEDFGVSPDAGLHRLTRRDALEGNPDLFAAAVAILKAMAPA